VGVGVVERLLDAGVPEELVEQARLALRRHHRLQALDVLWTWSGMQRLRACGRRVVGGTVALGTVDGVASVRGVQRCASIHCCPWCAPKIRHGRAQEINEAGTAHLEAGGGLLFVTLTVPHREGDSLRRLWDAVAGAYREVTQGGAWSSWGMLWGLDVRGNGRRRFGSIRSLEVTYGDNGWHPHLHVLVFTDRAMPEGEVELLREGIFGDWSAEVQRQGLRAPSRAHGVDVQAVRSVGELAPYLAGLDGTRVDLELARGDLKSGRGGSRSPFGILEDVRRWGDRDDLALWWEYEHASYRRNAITWSHGLKRFFGIGVVSDEDLAAEEVGLEVVLTLGAANWHRVIRAKVLSPLLCAIERGQEALAVELLDRAGAVWSQVWWGVPPDAGG
jgi:hypothetical protein